MPSVDVHAGIEFIVYIEKKLIEIGREINNILVYLSMVYTNKHEEIEC